jgi:hypothetical protein
MNKIFVSYSRRDAELVDYIVKKMEAAGMAVWIDRDEIKVGRTWRVQIVEAIDTCDAFVLMLSSNSAASDNVRKEIDLAQDSGRAIYIMKLDPVQLPAEMRYQLVGLQHIDVQALEIDVAVNQLLDTLKAHFTIEKPVEEPSVRQAELVIEGIDPAAFSPEKRQQLIDFISKLVNTPQTQLQIMDVQAGSVHVFVDMPARTAFLLKTLALNRDHRFKQFGIKALRLKGDRLYIHISLGILTTAATIGFLKLVWLSIPSVFPSLFGTTVGKVITIISVLVAISAVSFAIPYAGPILHPIVNRTLTVGNFNVKWSQTNPEEIVALRWKGSANLTRTLVHPRCPDDLQYFGNSWVSENEGTETFFFASLVGWGTTGTWTARTNTKITIDSKSSGCPGSANIPVNTRYQFFNDKRRVNLIVIWRTFDFGTDPYAHEVRPFIPRLYPSDGFTQVLHPDASGTKLMTDTTCDFGCRAVTWDGSWFAIHNPANGLGMIVQHRPSAYSVALWLDNDDGSFTNSSSVLLLQPSHGFTGKVTEAEYLCFYDDNIWTPSLTLPQGCHL